MWKQLTLIEQTISLFFLKILSAFLCLLQMFKCIAEANTMDPKQTAP